MTEARRREILAETVHVAIDVQTLFCSSRFEGSPQTERIADRIGRISNAFRKVGIPTYWVYSFWKPLRKYRPEECCYGFYNVKPDAAGGDRTIPKNDTSAFAGGRIERILRATGKKRLIVTGFNTSACVEKTVLDALSRQGFSVFVLTDCTDNGKTRDGISAPTSLFTKSIRTMIAAGAHTGPSPALFGILDDMKISLFPSLN